MYSHPCEKVVDEDINLICGEPAYDTVLIRSHTGKLKVWVCDKHKAEHNRQAAKLRAAAKK